MILFDKHTYSCAFSIRFSRHSLFALATAKKKVWYKNSWIVPHYGRDNNVLVFHTNTFVKIIKWGQRFKIPIISATILAYKKDHEGSLLCWMLSLNYEQLDFEKHDKLRPFYHYGIFHFICRHIIDNNFQRKNGVWKKYKKGIFKLEVWIYTGFIITFLTVKCLCK